MNGSEEKVVFGIARNEDLAEIIALLVDDDLGKIREVQGPEIDRCYWAAFSEIQADPNNEVIVGRIGDKIIATLQITYISNLTLRGSKRAQIEGVRVSSSLRGKGIGKELFQFSLERAKSKGCKIAQLSTNKVRKGAHQFYRSLGFVSDHEAFKCQIRI